MGGAGPYQAVREYVLPISVLVDASHPCHGSMTVLCLALPMALFLNMIVSFPLSMKTPGCLRVPIGVTKEAT